MFCSAEKSAKPGLLFIIKDIFDQVYIALNFIILGPEFECAFGKANGRVLVFLATTDIDYDMKLHVPMQ